MLNLFRTAPVSVPINPRHRPLSCPSYFIRFIYIRFICIALATFHIAFRNRQIDIREQMEKQHVSRDIIPKYFRLLKIFHFSISKIK